MDYEKLACNQVCRVIKSLGGSCTYDQFDTEADLYLFPPLTLAGFGEQSAFDQNQKVVACILAIEAGLIKKNATNTGYEII